MQHVEVFGIRIYECIFRPHHPHVYKNLNTGERLTDDDLPITVPSVEDDGNSLRLSDVDTIETV